MLATPFMPTMPPTNHKRRLSNRLSNSGGIYVPNSKRPRLNKSDDKHTENEGILGYRDDKQTMLFKMLPSAVPKLPPMARTAHMKEVQLSVVFSDHLSLDPSLNSLQSTRLPETKKLINHCGKSCHSHRVNGHKKNGKVNLSPLEVQCQQVTGKQTDVCVSDDEIPTVNLEKYEHNFKSEKASSVEKLSSSWLSGVVDSIGSESGGKSVPKIKIKQPAIFLMKMNHHVKKASTLSISSSSRVVIPEVSSVVIGGYVHRMANLNARACVAAFLQSERKRSSKVTKLNGHKKTAKSTKPEYSSKSTLTTTNEHSVPNHSNSEAVLLKVNGIERAIPVIRFETNGVEIPACAVIVQGLDECHDDDSKVPYNKLGLLYNGDTIHPHARVFLTQSVNHELQLPNIVVPTLVPSQFSTVKRVSKKATSKGVVHSKKKRSKKNNGWRPLGQPIKVMKTYEGPSRMSRKYYAGIKRRTEEIYVRDCVVIKAGTEKDESPYVAKVGSIWQEPDGTLLMTTFWYYRATDSEVQNAGVECVAREVLASQHHDVNSVECIEDKCHVLGFSQYCRYRASVVKSTIFGDASSGSIVPDLSHDHLPNATTKTSQLDLHDHDGISLVELDPKKLQLEDLGPSLSELQDVDPSLVFLCYRGFNHISGKLQTGKNVAARV